MPYKFGEKKVYSEKENGKFTAYVSVLTEQMTFKTLVSLKNVSVGIAANV